MLEKYAEAIEKIKRVDVLNAVVKQNNGKISVLTVELARLRKCNGRAEKESYDIKIYKANEKRSEFLKEVEKAKSEIKVLKSDALKILKNCYDETDKAEYKIKIKSATEYLFGGKLSLADGTEVGFKDLDIIGVVTTKDRSRKLKVAKTVKVGLKDDKGNVTLKPQVYLYEYSKDEEAGTFKKVDGFYKLRIAERENFGVLEYFKNRYCDFGIIPSVIMLIASIIMTVFSLTTGLLKNAYGFKTTEASVALLVLISIITVLFPRMKTGLENYLSAFCLVYGIVLFLIVLIGNFDTQGIAFPICLICYGVIEIVYSFITRNLKKKKYNPTTFCLLVGFLLACIFKLCDSEMVLNSLESGVVEYGQYTLLTVVYSLLNLVFVGCALFTFCFEGGKICLQAKEFLYIGIVFNVTFVILYSIGIVSSARVFSIISAVLSVALTVLAVISETLGENHESLDN